MIHFIINLLFVIPLIIGHHWTLLVTEMSPISAAMCSLFRLGQVYVANDILWWCKGRDINQMTVNDSHFVFSQKSSSSLSRAVQLLWQSDAFSDCLKNSVNWQKCNSQHVSNFLVTDFSVFEDKFLHLVYIFGCLADWQTSLTFSTFSCFFWMWKTIAAFFASLQQNLMQA